MSTWFFGEASFEVVVSTTMLRTIKKAMPALVFVLIVLALLWFVWWYYSKRIEAIDNKMRKVGSITIRISVFHQPK